MESVRLRRFAGRNLRRYFQALAAGGKARAKRNPPRLIEALEDRLLLSMTLTPGFSDAQITSGLSSPIAMTQAPDGRIFVTEQAGDVRIIQNGQLLATPFVTIPTDSSDQRGILGVALDPNFTTNHYVYIYYTAVTPNNHQRLSRFVANGNTAGAEQILADFPDANVSSDHMAGEIYFGLDGKIYVNTGDQDDAAVPQSLTSMFGKVLRFNSDGSIPTDNPFYTQTTGLYRAIYATGFRNPFTAAVNPVTGQIFVNDVGGGNWEEVDQLQAGGDYGWPMYDHSSGGVAGLVDPIFEYTHAIGQSITGGAFYTTTNPEFPAQYLNGYFIGDWAVNGIMFLNLQTMTLTQNFATGLQGPINMFVGLDGGLFYLNRGGGVGSGSVHEILATAAPQISLNPVGGLVTVGASFVFTADANGSPTPTLQWLRNNQPISGATGLSYTVNAAALTDDGAQYALQATSVNGIATSTGAILHVTSSLPPTASIISPLSQALFQGGKIISYTGLGTDPQDATLADSAYGWTVELLNDGVTKIVQTSTGASGTFTIPTTKQATKDVDASILAQVETTTAYRFILTVTDSAGLTSTTSVDIAPQLVNITLGASVPGLQVSLNGVLQTAPYTYQGIAGFADQTLAAPATQILAGVTYNFVGWSQGGAASQTVTYPNQDTTYTAMYQQSAAPVVGDGLLGSYYANTTLTGTAVTRIDPTVNLNLPGTSPGLGLNGATYSVEWTGQIQAPTTDTYTFYMTSDDGSRLWVNGVLLADQWYDHGPQTQKGSISLLAGQKYTIKVDYYQHGGGAQATLQWSNSTTPMQVVPTSALFSGGSNPNPNPTPTAPPPLVPGGPTLVGFTSATHQVTLSWTNNASDATGFLVEVSSDGSTNWTTAATVAGAATTTATLTYASAGTTFYYRVRALRSGDSTQSNPSAVLPVATPADVTPGTGDGLSGSYYNDTTLTGAAFTRVDPTVNFYLSGTSPMLGISAATFSVRWTGQVQAQYSETYTFYFTSDDGSRMWVNGQELVNIWWDHDLMTGKGTVNMVAGQKYDITVEYYQHGGNAGAKLEWSSASTPRQVIPQAFLFSGTSGGPVAPVTAPTGLTITQTLAHEIDLSWTNNAASATGFVVETSPDNAAWTQAGTTTAGVYTFQATGLSASTLYYYRVRAMAGTTLSDPSNVMSSTTLADAVIGAGSGLQAQYYNGITLSGTPITQLAPQVNFSLPGTAPIPGISGSQFSVRYTGSIVATTTDLYTLYLTSDDGSRMYINGVLVMDLWWNHDVITGRVNLNMVAGQKYTIEIDYYQDGGNAVANLGWSNSTMARQLVPTSALLTPGS